MSESAGPPGQELTHHIQGARHVLGPRVEAQAEAQGAPGRGGIGAHGKHVAVSVSVGDEVLFNRQAIELDVPMDDGNNEKLVIVQEHELLGYRAVKPAAKRGRPPKTEGEAAPTTVVNITAHGASPEAIADAVTQKAAELTTQRLSQKESV